MIARAVTIYKIESVQKFGLIFHTKSHFYLTTSLFMTLTLIWNNSVIAGYVDFFFSCRACRFKPIELNIQAEVEKRRRKKIYALLVGW